MSAVYPLNRATFDESAFVDFSYMHWFVIEIKDANHIFKFKNLYFKGVFYEYTEDTKADFRSQIWQPCRWHQLA